MITELIALTTTAFLGQREKQKRDYNRKVLFLIMIINEKVKRIYRAYIFEFVYESDSIVELMQEVTKDYPTIGSFDAYEVKNVGTPDEEQVFYALITL